MAENIHSVLLMRYNKLWHPQRIEQAEEVLHSEFARHGSSGSFRGIPSFKQYVKHFLSAFPDAQFLFRDWLWEGDKVAISYQFVGTHNGNFWVFRPQENKSALREPVSIVLLTAKSWSFGTSWI